MRLPHFAAMLAAVVFFLSVSQSSPARTIAWPDGCDYGAHAPGEHPIANACAEAIDGLEWSKLPRREDGEAACDPDLSRGIRGERGYPFSAWSDGGRGEIGFIPLGRGRFLLQIQCGTGAYNATYIYVLYDESRRPVHAEFLWFPVYRMRDGVPVKEIAPYVFGRSFNPGTRELVALAKYRGMGDCGEFSRYVLRGNQLVLTEFRAKTECDGRDIYQLRRGLVQPSPHWKRYLPP